MKQKQIYELKVPLEIRAKVKENLDEELLLFDNLSDLFPLMTYASRISYYAIGLCTKGSCTFLLDLQEYKLKPGFFVATMPNQIIQMTSLSEDFKGCFIALSKTWMEIPYLNKLEDLSSFSIYVKDHPCIRVEKLQKKIYLDFYHFLEKKIKEPNRYRKEMMHVLITGFILNLCGIFDRRDLSYSNSLNRRKKMCEQFLRDLPQFCTKERTIDFYAERSCVTAKHFSFVIKEETGRTANEWITDFVVMEAKALLKTTNLDIKEIAYKLNFPSSTFFGKYFKRYVGVSPKSFRDA